MPDIIFREQLEQFANRMPGLQLRFTVEEPDYLEREVFCCGPEPFMLVSLGYDMGRYHQEGIGAPMRAGRGRRRDHLCPERHPRALH